MLRRRLRNAFVTGVGQWELWEPRMLTWAGEKVMHHIKGVMGCETLLK